MMNSEDPATLGGVVLTVIALLLSLLKLICWGRGQRGGNTLGLGDRGGPGKEGGAAFSQGRCPRNSLHSTEGSPPCGRDLERKGLHFSLPNAVRLT